MPSQYLNNVVEQDCRFIKKITNPIMGFKAFIQRRQPSMALETAHMIRRGDSCLMKNIPVMQIMALAG